jgi:hypothetical protein
LQRNAVFFTPGIDYLLNILLKELKRAQYLIFLFIVKPVKSALEVRSNLSEYEFDGGIIGKFRAAFVLSENIRTNPLYSFEAHLFLKEFISSTCEISCK